MRQIQIDRFGDPEELHLVEVDDPVPGPGQVVVQVDAAGITFVETQIRAGRPPWPGGGPKLPTVLGNGVEGTIVALGDGVDPALLGQRVVTATGGTGGYADRVVVDAADPIQVPEGLAVGEAVALLADGRTALALARAAAITTVDRVLITAAGGGVGSLLVQLAKRANAKLVVAAAGSERKLTLARELGADLAVDYMQPDWDREVEAVVGGIYVAFDGVGGKLGQMVLGLVEPEGRFLAYGMASGTGTDLASAAERGITVIAGLSIIRSPDDNRQLVEQALELAAAGDLRPVIGQRFPLSRAAEAHATIEARATLGKTLLIPER